MSVALNPLLTITDVVRRSGAATSTLRFFYESRGFIASVRARQAPALRALNPAPCGLDRFAQRAGFMLAEIAVQLPKPPDKKIR